MKVLPLRLSFPGPVAAVGLYLPEQLYPPARARALCREQWLPGCRLYRLSDGLYLEFPFPQLLDPRAGPGLPVADLDGLRSTLPLTPGERRRLGPGGDRLLLARRGEVTFEPLDAALLLEPGELLDPAGIRIARTSPIAGRPAAPDPAPEGPPAPLATILHGRVPEPAPGRAAQMERLARRELDEDEGLGPLLGAILHRLIHGRGRPGTRGTRPGGGAAGAAADAAADTGPGPVVRLLDGLVRGSGLWRLFAGAQARYFNRMVRLLQEGDLEQGLRHAIPLSDATRGALARLPAWAMPRPRLDLRLTPAGEKGGAWGIDGGGFEMLRELYTAAARRLEQQERIEEAAWVLAELLKEDQRAADLLERHGRLREAAQLAETRGVDPTQVVRLWLLAGEPARAGEIARRNGAFAAAIALLQPRHPELADTLRAEWAAGAAGAGDYETAVQAAWPVAALRPQALAWLDLAIDQGGPAGARLLARRLGAEPERFTEDAQRVERLLASPEPQAPGIRAELLRSLLAGPRTPAACAMAHRALRRVAPEWLRGENSASKNELQEALHFIGDAALLEEWPLALPAPHPTVQLARAPHPAAFSASGSGTLPIADLCLTACGRYALALGEAGVLLAGAGGKAVARFPLPADRLVPNDTGNRLITVAHRGEARRLGRIDLARRRGESWSEGLIDCHADSCDGALWFTARGNSLFALDLHAEGLRSHWSVGELPGPVRSLARAPGALSLLIAPPGAEPQIWHYQLPQLRLRSREAVTGCGPDYSAGLLAPDGALFEIWSEAGLWRVSERRNATAAPREFPLTGHRGLLRRGQVLPGWLLLKCDTPEGPELLLYDQADKRLRARVAFERPGGRLCWRIQGDDWLIASDAGQVIHLDLKRGVKVAAFAV